MDKKGVSQIVVMMVIMVVVAVVLIYSLRVIPQEVERQQTCGAHAGFCADESECPSGTQRINYDCTENRPCCIGIVESEDEESEDTRITARRAVDSRPAEGEERRRIAEIQERLTTAREEGDLARISAEYDAAKELIVARFAQYRPPTNQQMTQEMTPFDYNTVKSFEQLTLAAEAAFRIASEEKKQYAASQGYFSWMCLSWLLLLRAHLLGYYDESTYSLDNWLANKNRVFRDYSEYIGFQRGSQGLACEAIIPVYQRTSLTRCKEFWLDARNRNRALEKVSRQEETTEDDWGPCFGFRRILEPYTPIIDFEQESFRIANFFYPQNLETIFSEEGS